jgi:hypothetical protein
MAHNEDSDPVDDDDQHVLPWQSNSPPQIASSTSDQPSSSHLVTHRMGDGKPTSP